MIFLKLEIENDDYPKLTHKNCAYKVKAQNATPVILASKWKRARSWVS